jgi:outer membrane protein
MNLNFRATLIFAATFGLMSPNLANAQNSHPRNTWELTLGAGLLTGPTYEGAEEYQVSAVPYVRIAYKDILFASMEEGVGVNLFNQEGWRAGPLVRVAFAREEDGGSSPFRIGGKKTKSLEGLGDIRATPEPGAFLEYTWNNLSAMLEARRGIGGHKGTIGSAGLLYTQTFPALGGVSRAPTILSAGVSATFVSRKYAQAYFGVTPLQASNSALSEFNAGGGLHSYGANILAITPIAQNVSLTLIANYKRLTGDAGRSPLVRERGSRNQGTLGLFVAYRFGL